MAKQQRLMILGACAVLLWQLPCALSHNLLLQPPESMRSHHRAGLLPGRRAHGPRRMFLSSHMVVPRLSGFRGEGHANTLESMRASPLCVFLWPARRAHGPRRADAPDQPRVPALLGGRQVGAGRGRLGRLPAAGRGPPRRALLPRREDRRGAHRPAQRGAPPQYYNSPTQPALSHIRDPTHLGFWIFAGAILTRKSFPDCNGGIRV